MVLQSDNVSVGSSAPLRVLATGRVREPVWADSFCPLNAAAEQERKASKTWLHCNNMGVISGSWGKSHMDAPLESPTNPSGPWLGCQQPCELTQSPQHEAWKWVEQLVPFIWSCLFIQTNLCLHTDWCISCIIWWNQVESNCKSLLERPYEYS